MNYFYYIHKNLYEMYFKKCMNFRNQFDYLNSLYYLGNDDEKSVFESIKYNKYKEVDKWLKKGRIDDSFFTFDGENFLFRDDLLSLLTEKMNNFLFDSGNLEKLRELLCDLVNNPEMLKYYFEIPENYRVKLNSLFNSSDIVDFLAVLLIFAQTGRITEPYTKSTKKRTVEVYDKSTITEHFCELVNDAIEIDMMQISVPSLIEKYTDFYKSGNYNALINLLDNGCRINFIFSGYIDELKMQNTVYCYKNDFSLFGNVIEDSISFAKELKSKYPQQIAVRRANYPISYSLMIIKKRRYPAIAKVDLYLIKGSADTRHSFIFRSDKDTEGYSLYRDNFSDIFNDSQIIEI